MSDRLISYRDTDPAGSRLPDLVIDEVKLITDAVLDRRAEIMRSDFAIGATRAIAKWVNTAGDTITLGNTGGTGPTGLANFDPLSDASPGRARNGIRTPANGGTWNAPWNNQPDFEWNFSGRTIHVAAVVPDPSQMYQWVVDGKEVGQPAPYGNQGIVWISITFDAAQKRNVVLRTGGAQIGFYAYPSADFGALFKPQKHHFYVGIGNSMWSGAGSNENSHGYGMPEQIGALIGKPVFNAGAGATGYRANNDNAPAGVYGSTQTVAAIAALPQDRLDGVIFGGAANDVSWIAADPANRTVAQVLSNASAAFARLYAALPTVPVAVMGVEPIPVITSTPERTANATAINNGLRDICKAAPNVVTFVDPFTDPWLGANEAGFYTMADGLHWYPAATQVVARRFLEESFND